MPNGDPELILAAIEDVFDVDIVSEHQPQYWGFATEEEWNAAQENMFKELEQKKRHFWNEVVRYAKGETAELEQSLYSGSVAAEMAHIAKKLISESSRATVLSPPGTAHLRHRWRCWIVGMAGLSRASLAR
jgi:hypothetical protein